LQRVKRKLAVFKIEAVQVVTMEKTTVNGGFAYKRFNRRLSTESPDIVEWDLNRWPGRPAPRAG